MVNERHIWDVQPIKAIWWVLSLFLLLLLLYYPLYYKLKNQLQLTDTRKRQYCTIKFQINTLPTKQHRPFNKPGLRTSSWCHSLNPKTRTKWIDVCVVLSGAHCRHSQCTQPAVKVRQFYTSKRQCPCPISLRSESGLNMPILILPNKLNQQTGRKKERSSCQTHNSLSSQPARRPGHFEKSLVNWFRTWSVFDKYPKTEELISGGASGKFG